MKTRASITTIDAAYKRLCASLFFDGVISSTMSFNQEAKVTSDMNAVHSDLVSTLKLLYNTHLKGETQVSADGNNQAIPASLSNIATIDANTANNAAASTNGLFVNVLNRAKFVASYTGTNAYSSVTLSNVYFCPEYGSNAPNTKLLLYDTLTVANTDSNLTIPSLKADVNCYDMLMSNGFTSLASQLRELKLAYQLLDDDVFQNVTNSVDANGELSIFPNEGYYRIYDMKMIAATGGKMKAKIVNNAANAAANETDFESSESLVKFVRTLNPATQDIFVLRRLILGTYLAAQFHFFMNVFISKKLVTDKGDEANFAAKVAFHFYNKLQKLNMDYESSLINTDQVTNSVQERMNANVKEYKNNTTRLAFLHTDISNKKRFLTNEMARITSEQASSNYATKLTIITASFAVIFAIAMLVVFVLPFDLATRMKLAGVIAVLVLVLAVAISATVRNVDPITESFAPLQTDKTGTVLTPAQSYSAVASGTMDTYKSLVELMIMEELRNFYRSTSDIAMALKNNRLYSELNYNTGKERNYFESSQYQLNKAVTDARNMQRLFDRKTKISTAFIRLFLQLIVIVAFVLIGIMAIQEALPSVRPVIYTFGGIAATLAFIVFFADVLGRTRTDADKMYWGTPDAVRKL